MNTRAHLSVGVIRGLGACGGWLVFYALEADGRSRGSVRVSLIAPHVRYKIDGALNPCCNILFVLVGKQVTPYHQHAALVSGVWNGSNVTWNDTLWLGYRRGSMGSSAQPPRLIAREFDLLASVDEGVYRIALDNSVQPEKLYVRSRTAINRRAQGREAH